MPHPLLAFCPHTHMDIIKAAELLHYYGQEGTQNDRSNKLNDGNVVLDTSLGVMRSLKQIYQELNNIPQAAGKEDLLKLASWQQVKDDLMSENVFIRLAKDNRKYFRKNLMVWLCEKESVECNLSPASFGAFHSYQLCRHFDMFSEGAMDEATSQGIGNGLTVVLMAENTIFNAAFNYSIQPPIPGMENIMSPNTGMKGIRLIVSELGQYLQLPQDSGIDIPPRVSATIGLTAKRTRHLQAPYTDCSLINPEINLLIEVIRESLGNNTPDAGDGLFKGTYSQIRCR